MVVPLNEDSGLFKGFVPLDTMAIREKISLLALRSALAGHAREVLANAATTEQFDLLLSETYAAYFNKICGMQTWLCQV
jgi:hypothetical protein